LASALHVLSENTKAAALTVGIAACGNKITEGFGENND
jgi:hypothetical protein